MLWWIITVVAALAAGLVIGRRRGAAPWQRNDADTAQKLANLQSLNALLRTLTSSSDITQSLFELALRIRDIVPCDRVGLALLTTDRESYNTYTARLDSTGSPTPRADLNFPRGATVIDEVVITRQPRVIDDLTELAPTYIDANVSKSAGFSSFVLVPLVFEGEALGTLNLASRRRAAFSPADLHTLMPVAEALAMAHGTRRLVQALARHEMANEFSELTFAFANDMSGAVQVIIGQCELLAHKTGDPEIERALADLLHQARRLREILSNMQRMTREHATGAHAASMPPGGPLSGRGASPSSKPQ
jgi:transcriptional regulator with GAF, ATPase, and Fis domain